MKVKITCYRQTKIWNSREDAMKFYYEAMMNSKGSEAERYSKIYGDLKLGLNEVSDE